jgi:hypothetical protein
MTTEQHIDQILTELLADYRRPSPYKVARAREQLLSLIEGGGHRGKTEAS